MSSARRISTFCSCLGNHWARWRAARCPPAFLSEQDRSIPDEGADPEQHDCTNVLPWLLMFRAMGYGFFGAHGPAGTRLFVSSLVSHAFFGLGI